MTLHIYVERSRRCGKTALASVDYRAIQPQRGYLPVYRTGTACPGCGYRAFLVGRASAECGRCGTALPLAPADPEAAHG
ncbi:MAG TPA: hypothetical protein VFT56_01155 [Sphingomonas sp.]|nr:hypothetical protein [Sphingomonas sp.]